MHLSNIKEYCTPKSQNCTWLCLVQLLNCYSYNYSLIALKCTRLPILIKLINETNYTIGVAIVQLLTVNLMEFSKITLVYAAYTESEINEIRNVNKHILCA